ncbi:MAG: hypothetical protein QM674_17650 [Burkholderiaceae bacterium]
MQFLMSPLLGALSLLSGVIGWFAQVDSAPPSSPVVGAPYFLAAGLRALGLVMAPSFFRRRAGHA